SRGVPCDAEREKPGEFNPLPAGAGFNPPLIILKSADHFLKEDSRMKSCAHMAALSILALGIAAPAQANFLTNGDFSGGLSNWNIWVERDDFSGNTGQFEVDIPGAGDVRIRGWSFNGG